VYLYILNIEEGSNVGAMEAGFQFNMGLLVLLSRPAAAAANDLSQHGRAQMKPALLSPRRCVDILFNRHVVLTAWFSLGITYW
jgi:hypothetical protein